MKYLQHFLKALCITISSSTASFLPSIWSNKTTPHSVSVLQCYMSRDLRKRPFKHKPTVKVQISLCICAVWSGPSLSTDIITGFIPLGLTKIPWHFPDVNSNFPNNIGATNFMNLWEKYIGTKQPSYIRLKCKIPWHFPELSAKFHFSLTQHKIPWQFPDLEKKNSLTFPLCLWTLNYHWILQNAWRESKGPDDTLHLRILSIFKGTFSFDRAQCTPTACMHCSLASWSSNP